LKISIIIHHQHGRLALLILPENISVIGSQFPTGRCPSAYRLNAAHPSRVGRQQALYLCPNSPDIPQSRALHQHFSPSDLRSQHYSANECQNSRRLKGVPAFRLPLRFLVALIPSFTLRNAGLSACQGIRIFEKPFLIFQIERLNRLLLCLCCVFIGFHSCTIPLVSSKASVLFCSTIIGDSAFERIGSPAPFKRLGNQLCLILWLRRFRVRVRKFRQLLGCTGPESLLRRPV